MASYTTNLKDWGATGSEYPTGYDYVEGEQPVDEWDNFLTDNLISDIKGHLIPLTNSRVETDYGASGSEPASPETSHIYHDQDNERLELWDATASSWRDLMFRDGDTMTGALDMGNYPISGVTTFEADSQVLLDPSSGSLSDGGSVDSNVTTFRGYYDSDGTTSVTASSVDATIQHVANSDGSSVLDGRVQSTDIFRAHSSGLFEVPNGGLTIGGDLTAPGGETIWDESATYIPQGRLQNDSVTVTAGTDLINGGTVSLGGSITVDHADTSTQGNVSASAGAAITDVNLDGRGHVTSLGTTDFDSRYDNYSSWTIQEGNGSESQAITSGETLTIYGGTEIQTEMDSNNNLQVDFTGNYDNYDYWTIEEGDGEQTNVHSGQKLEIYGGTDLNTEVTSTGGETRLRIDHNNTSGQGDVTTGGSTVIDDIYVDGRGHVTNMNTQNRSLDDWNGANSALNIGHNNLYNVNKIEDNGVEVYLDDGNSRVEIQDNNSNRIEILCSRIYLENGSGWFDGSHDQLSSVGAHDHHNPANQDVDSVDGYDVVKNGSDANGVLNFKT